MMISLLTVARLKSLSNDIQRKVARSCYSVLWNNTFVPDLSGSAQRPVAKTDGNKSIRVWSILEGYWHHCGSRVAPLDSDSNE